MTRMASAAAAVLVAATLPVIGASAAHAAALNVCEGTEISTYTPPIQVAPEPTTVRATGSLTCVGDLSDPAATLSDVRTGTLSCVSGGSTSAPAG